jgi:protein tyrosine/serine phosphatase
MKKIVQNVWLRRCFWVAVVAIVLEQVWRHGHDYLLADRFAEVEPGRIYRGAWQQDWPMRRLVADHKIKTILALAHPPGNTMVLKEQTLAKELGCRWVHIPIVDDRTVADSAALFDRLESAAGVLADSSNQPVYFHCHHGINRASMVQMAYRMLYCGWTLDESTTEISQTFGLRQVDKGPDYRHMTKFYNDRVLTRRSSQSKQSVAQRGVKVR